MSVGFVMLAHDALHRAAEVVRVISAAGCPVAIHVDRRVAAEDYERFEYDIADLDGVFLHTPRHACDWGTWSLVEASRDAAEALLERHADLGHVCLISGACLPIRPITELKAHLAAHQGTDFIESVTIGDVPWTKGGLSEERFSLSFPFAWKRQRRLFDLWVEVQRFMRFRRRMPDGLKPHMGSQWWCLSRATLERILNDPRRPALDRYFRRVWIPDESYFQSLVRLYDTKVESRSLTLSKFDVRGKSHVFYDDHLPLLRQSTSFFARKIWPGANRLYSVFLNEKVALPPMANVSPALIDRTFDEASKRRTVGRPGLTMVSRHPSVHSGNELTAAPYAVFHGLSDIFEDVAEWIARNTGSRSHGHLFARDRAEFCDSQSGYVGGLSDDAALRDYDPGAFLRNLIWNTRGEHQSFLFGSRDAQGICPVVAADRNATVAVVTGAWALPLLRTGRPVAEVRKEAANCQKREAAFVEMLSDRKAMARSRIWSLAEFLERPLDPLQEMVDSLAGTETRFVAGLPRMMSTQGLPEFLQALKNAGMNPHLAGEIRHLPEEPTSGDLSMRLS